MFCKTKRLKRVEIRLNDAEYQKVERFAMEKGMPMAEVLRDYIKSLPDTVYSKQ